MRSSLCKFAPSPITIRKSPAETSNSGGGLMVVSPPGLRIAKTITPDFRNSSNWPKVFLVNSPFWRNADLFHGDFGSDIASGEVHEFDH
jgi:hypothetical protein